MATSNSPGGHDGHRHHAHGRRPGSNDLSVLEAKAVELRRLLPTLTADAAPVSPWVRKARAGTLPPKSHDAYAPPREGRR